MRQQLKQMTYHEARKKLEKYYEYQELAKSLGLGAAGIIVVVNKERTPTSSVENTTAKVFDLQAQMKDTDEALKQLPAEYVRYIEARFKDRLSGRHAAKRLKDEKICSITHPHRYERDVLSAYIAALNCVPVGC